uniref:Uncharacterized protein n=1 Tax=Corethron hystrix TaxID=216773 RepID=A0A7S1BGI0_9STRA|mmetsp:Transcript_2688/g.5091  ORF Transcript_2688/g.5091 Transcript_2688/m.5091 type:complete len:211 (+) Transcript_2688:613-1245(+)
MMAVEQPPNAEVRREDDVEQQRSHDSVLSRLEGEQGGGWSNRCVIKTTCLSSLLNQTHVGHRPTHPVEEDEWIRAHRRVRHGGMEEVSERGGIRGGVDDAGREKEPRNEERQERKCGHSAGRRKVPGGNRTIEDVEGPTRSDKGVLHFVLERPLVRSAVDEGSSKRARLRESTSSRHPPTSRHRFSAALRRQAKPPLLPILRWCEQKQKG